METISTIRMFIGVSEDFWVILFHSNALYLPGGFGKEWKWFHRNFSHGFIANESLARRYLAQEFE